MEVVGEASSGEEATEKVRELGPDVVVMDLAMPGIGGLAATRQIKAEFPAMQILILTMLEDERYFFPRPSAGGLRLHPQGGTSRGVPLGPADRGHRHVLSLPVPGTEARQRYLSRAKSEQGRMAADGLTDREQQIIVLISEGRTGKEMAKTLGISPHTVERHRQNLMTKLDLHSRAELIEYAIRKGLLERDA